MNLVKADLKQSSLPESPTRFWISCLALGCSTLVFLKLHKIYSLSVMQITLLTMGTLAATILILEMIILKSHRRPSTGLDFSSPRPRCWRDIITRLIGFYTTLLFLGILYWLLQDYQDSYFLFYFKFLGYAVTTLCVLAPPYFIILDRYQIDRHDGFWHMGTVVFLRFSQVNPSELKQHLLSWTVKAFFLPLMFTPLAAKLNTFLLMKHLPTDVLEWYHFSLGVIFGADLLFASTGYIFTLRIFDTHIRSVEPTLLGWGVTLACYPPFLSFMNEKLWHQGPDFFWLEKFENAPLPLFILWGAITIALFLIYLFATFSFGTRFSNLTHRGILTNGPYRFCKHPAYVSKNLGWWLMGLPFLAGSTIAESIKLSIALVIINVIYFLRARTEERHLSRDPAYVVYAEAMNQRSVLAWLGRLIPALQYRDPNSI